MAKQIQIILAGAVIVVPLGATIAVIVWIGLWVGGIGSWLLSLVWADIKLPPYVGVLVVLGLLYAVGLLARTWLFGRLFSLLDRILSRVPGVKTIYESIRDILKLFAGDPAQMGKAVLYRQPGTDMVLLGIRTNERPEGVADRFPDQRVAIYQPYSYMFGGPTVYVPADHVTEIDMSVDKAMKLCATAHVGAMVDERGAKSENKESEGK